MRKLLQDAIPTENLHCSILTNITNDVTVDKIDNLPRYINILNSKYSLKFDAFI